ncbi:hypothetical protein [Cytobacillus oceanisediminis]|uniref:hypothetical protein n=1 Tax=Cytobacillus oceanisediminis TaxID=665099 RepID=UPI001FB26163|nr:hypothetical protein [Cytobacillus oceanisediminis]UOE57303.1 hypothetical protein IRB79_11390 [Cytobacillus oceanisediminis]
MIISNRASNQKINLGGVTNLPKAKVRNKNITEQNLMGEGKLVNNLPRVEKGNKETSKQESDLVIRARSIKLKKVKGTYGTFIVKERFIPDDIRNTLYLSFIVGILIVIFNKNFNLIIITSCIHGKI